MQCDDNHRRRVHRGCGKNAVVRTGQLGKVSYWHFAPVLFQGVYKFNQANFQEIPGGILRKIQDMFALLWPPSEATMRAEMPVVGVFQLSVSPRIYDFLLVIKSNFGPISHRF